MELKPDQVSILDGILCILSRLNQNENHDTVLFIIVDYLNEIGFKAYGEYTCPYKLKLEQGIISVDGRLDFYATRNNFSISGEIETSNISSPSIRKLYKMKNSIKLLILLRKACGWIYTSPYIIYLNNFIIIPFKSGHLIKSDIPCYHGHSLEDFRADKKTNYFPRWFVENFFRYLPEPRPKGE